jgi:hypothetical protein
MKKGERLILIGTGAFAQVAYEYFTHDSPYEVVGFAVEKDFIDEREIFGLPVVPFEEVTEHFAPSEHHFFVAITYYGLNRARAALRTGAGPRLQGRFLCEPSGLRLEERRPRRALLHIRKDGDPALRAGGR